MIESRAKIFRSLILSVHVGLAMKVAAGALPREEANPAFEMLDALREGRFRFAVERWHSVNERRNDQILPSEMLLRPYNEEGAKITPLMPITAISRVHLQANLDKALILAAIDQGLREDLGPISINTSARNMRSAEFWNDVSKMLRENFTPEEIKNNLTFEVTEDDLADDPCREVLLHMKDEFGCSFAIDDFYHDRAYHIENNSGFDSDDWKRLENLKEFVTYVKIDGETVEASLLPDSTVDLHSLMDRIKTYVPQVQFVFERVKNADQAYVISEYGEDISVQGWDLTNDRAGFKEELFLASTNFPPRPAHLRPNMKK